MVFPVGWGVTSHVGEEGTLQRVPRMQRAIVTAEGAPVRLSMKAVVSGAIGRPAHLGRHSLLTERSSVWERRSVQAGGHGPSAEGTPVRELERGDLLPPLDGIRHVVDDRVRPVLRGGRLP